MPCVQSMLLEVKKRVQIQIFSSTNWNLYTSFLSIPLFSTLSVTCIVRFYPISLDFSLMDSPQGKAREILLFNSCLPLYQGVLLMTVLPLWWHEHIHSSWYLHQNVRAAPAHLLVLHRSQANCLYMRHTPWRKYPRSSMNAL